MNYVLNSEVEAPPKMIHLKLGRNDKHEVVLQAKYFATESVWFNVITFKNKEVIIDEFGHAKRLGMNFTKG